MNMPSGLEIVFLGTGGALPTKQRGLPSLVVRRETELLMFDCGEGTQRQMMHAGIGLNKPMTLFISHLHPDHTLGLPGLLMTMTSLMRENPMHIYGPPGFSLFYKTLRKALPVETSFSIEITDLKPGDTVDRTEYMVKTTLAKHDIPCLAYSMEEKPRPGRFYPTKAKKLGVPEGPLWRQLQYGEAVKVDGRTVKPGEVTGPPRPGLKVVYAIDTRPVDRIRRLAKNADVLLHDGGFEESRREKADEYFHSTAKEAAEVAKRAGAKKLVLIHISAVSRDDRILLKEARSVFKDTIVPKDLTTLFLNRP